MRKASHIFFFSQITETLLKTMTSYRTLLVLMAVRSAFGYTTSTPTTKPAFLHRTKQVPASKPQTYDLGLGKNPPVMNSSKAVVSMDVQTASQFWIAPEPAVEFPAPESMIQKRPAHSIRHKRQAKDVLTISEARTIHQSQEAKLDMNTVWVEALIHDQQMRQLAYAS